jgi:3-deoxy-manno-octulosonate cytidylyltransferase (CMP-KDO synthetase)
MSALGIIPARFASQRFPGKVLAPIDGIPMLQRVWEGARGAKRLREIAIATDDERVLRACERFGARAVLTRADHPTGTDRVAEAALGESDDIVVNIQGDEPLIEGFVIDAAVEALEADLRAPMATVAHLAGPESEHDPNRVKVVLDRRGYALYFSRSPIPARRAGAPAPRWLQHIGLYAYRRSFLLEFVTLAQTPAERSEGLEQLRALEHGFPIRCAVIEGWTSAPVDVPADLELVRQRLRARADAEGSQGC